MKMRKELNNKGFSLVELLIATVILAIVVAPLLHTFVTAASTTARSRQLGDATLLGENIAEAVEVTSLDKLEGLFADPCFTGARDTTFNLDDETGVYSLSAKSVRAGSSVFNVMVTLDPRVYRTDNHKGINDIDIADYSNMDGVYAQSRDVDDPDELAWADFKNKADSKHPQGGWDHSSVEPVRTMTLKITKDATEKVFAKLDLDYVYTYRYTEVDEVTQQPSIKTGRIAAQTIPYKLIPQGYSLAGDKGLPNLYVMYYPLYGTDSVTNDIIRIENEAALPFKIFLVKERGNNLFGELQYHANVEQYVPSGTPSTKYAKIYSNIREDLSDDTNDVALPGVSYRIYRGDYFSVTGHFEGEHGDLVSKSARNRLFETTVNIFAASDTTFSDPIHTFRSTKLQ